MSPQSRATKSDATFVDGIDGGSGNPCPNLSSVAEITRAANAAFALHKIESNSSNDPPGNNPLGSFARPAGAVSLRKRPSTHLNLSDNAKQPFLSSYGSAFLSGIFADIAQASEHREPHLSDPEPERAELNDDDNNYLPCKKKSKASPASSLRCHAKSHMALAELAEGANVGAPLPHVVSPRSNVSPPETNPLNDQVRELQNLAFPSLPQLPVTVSSSSCSSSNMIYPSGTRANAHKLDSERDSTASYGWFVSTESDSHDDTKDAACRIYSSNQNPDLAFKAITAPNAENHDIEVQQALAADTIDDVLGDFF